MVALARVQKPRTEIVILCLQIIGKLSVTTKLMGTSTKLTVSRLAWEIHHMVINAKSLALEWMKSVPTSYHLQGIERFAFKLRTATLMGAQWVVIIASQIQTAIMSSALDAEMEKWKWKAKIISIISTLLASKMERKYQEILYARKYVDVCEMKKQVL